MHWGTFCHAYVGLPEEDRINVSYPLLQPFKESLDKVAAELIGYTKEIAYKRSFSMTVGGEDWEIIMSYRLDAQSDDPLNQKVVELKFPQTMWTRAKANSDLKTLCYKMFHNDVEIWCTTPDGKFEKIPVTTGQDKAYFKVTEQLKIIIGRLSLNYFNK